MRFEWDDAKRKSNLKTHDLDFADAEIVFGGLTVSYEDDRFRYNEQRLVTLGLLRGIPVSIVHSESQDVIRIFSFRRATHNETAFFFETIADSLPAGQIEPEADKGHSGTSRTRPKARRAGHRKKRTKTRSP
jgi:uncharacterized DUF497 family protein